MTWRWMRLKHLAAVPIVNGLGEAATLEDESWPRYIRTTDFATPRQLRDSTLATLPPEVAAKAPVHRGDILISAAGTVGKTYLHLADGPACFAGYLVRFRPTADVDPRFVSYWTETPLFLDQVATGKVTSTIDNFSAGKYQNLAIRIPTFSQQRAIADFLDTETARIDALITKRRCMIDLLQERWHAERDHVLVDRVDVTMVPLARLTDPYRPIVYGIVQAGDHVEHGVPYIKTGDLEDFDPRRLSRTSADIDHQYRRARVHPGDLVMAMRASIGALVEIPENLPHANLTQGTARIAAAQGVSRRWLTHVLGTSTVQEQCQDRAVGSTFRTLNIWDLRRVQVPTPPLRAQEELIRHLDRLEVRVREGTRAIGRQISLLQEHRQALITATITGELEVPGVAA